VNHTDANLTGEDRRRAADPRVELRRALASTRTDPACPAPDLGDLRRLDMHGPIHEQLARQRDRELCLEARRSRLVRAVRARERARRAAEVAARAVERAAAEPHPLAARRFAPEAVPADG
jgi:hypothetical protein